MPLAQPGTQGRSLSALFLAIALLGLYGCAATETPAPNPNLPTTKAETLETMNESLQLVLEGVMAYETATTPPERAPLGTIRRYGCVQGNTDYLAGPPWQYFFTTGDTYTPDKERLLVKRIHDLTETGWRITQTPETEAGKLWSITQEQGFVISIELPTEQSLSENTSQERWIAVTTSSPCVDVIDNDR